MVLTKYFELFGISVPLSKSILIFKCDCLSGSNNLNLQLEIAFFFLNLEHAKISKYSVPQS